ncbi:MAG TPA: DUF5916 domain-containing protein [Thermoanaerobaculia bacterium]|nr:DUF5916 domain-containing protein [Thermoanaerobaculia bacterium]
MTARYFAGALLLLAAARLAAAPDLPPIEIHRSTGTIAVDGDLSDPGWRDAVVVDEFWETQPGDNTPPKVKTRALLAYDAKYLYIGIDAQDPEPRNVRAPYVDRDQVLGTDDNIAVFLDTRNDRRSAVELRVNPRGSQGDASWNEATGTEDFSPDLFYDTAARVTATGWTAEYRIPFSSLRYPRSERQTWGILIWRNYPRDFRYGIYSSPIPRGSNCLICHMRPLTGLSGLPEGGHLVVAPYATATQNARPQNGLGSDLESEGAEADAGLDVKWTPGPNHAIDATVNPDFSQVESDVAQIAVNQRFALFFPEKRPFFLEGVDLLETPIPAVYTRTITSPRWGLRSTGKLGGSAYTLLVTEDRGGGLVILPGPDSSLFAPQDFRSIAAIGRLRRDFGNSFAGFLVTDREVRGGGHNRVFGPDFEWRPDASNRITGQFLWSETKTPDRTDLADEWDGRSLSGGASDLRWTYTERGPEGFLHYRDLGNGFRADDGFVPQVGVRLGEAYAAWKFFPEGLLNLVRPQIFSTYVEKRDGFLIDRNIAPGVIFQGKRNLLGDVELNLAATRIAGRVFQKTNLFFLFQVDPSRRFSRISLDGNVGEEFDFENGRVGDGVRLATTITVKPTDHLALELIGNRQTLDVKADDGHEGRLFTAHIGRIKATCQFTARALLRLIGQWIETERDPSLYRFDVPRRSGGFDGSALFSYKINWQTLLFVGYGDNRALLSDGDLVRSGRSLFLKISYAFQS